MQHAFGSGVLWAVPQLALNGSAVVNPAATLFGALQDVSIDISFGKKELYGMYQFPLAVARGTGKIDCKAKSAAISAALFNQMFGLTMNTGEIKGQFQEAGTIPASGSYILQVANHSTYVMDLGVMYAATGLPLTRVTSVPAPGGVGVFHVDPANPGSGYSVGNILTVTEAGSGGDCTILVTAVGASGALINSGLLLETPGTVYTASESTSRATTVAPSGGTGGKIFIDGVGTAGEYSIDPTTGTYTFSSADEGVAVLMSYTYTSPAAPGENFTITNQLLGQAPYFAIVFNIIFQGKNFNLQLFQCMSTKLTLATKIEDFLIPEFDFSAMANSAQQIGSMSLAQP